MCGGAPGAGLSAYSDNPKVVVVPFPAYRSAGLRMQEDTMSVKFTGASKTDPPFCECTEFRIIRMIASCPPNHLLMQAIARRFRAATAALLPTTIPI